MDTACTSLLSYPCAYAVSARDRSFFYVSENKTFLNIPFPDVIKLRFRSVPWIVPISYAEDQMWERRLQNKEFFLIFLMLYPELKVYLQSMWC